MSLSVGSYVADWSKCSLANITDNLTANNITSNISVFSAAGCMANTNHGTSRLWCHLFVVYLMVFSVSQII
jgi:hypothetical protein